MTVGELIVKLAALPQGALVVQSKDAEGNGFAACHEVEAASIHPSELEGGMPDGHAYGKKRLAAVIFWPR